MRRTLLLSLFALAVAPLALADGPQVTPGTSDGGTGLVSPAGDVRYATFQTGPTTVLETIGTSDGTVDAWRALPGSWGVPDVAFDGSHGGLSPDGKTLVLAGNNSGYRCTRSGCSLLRTTSRFMVFTPKTLHVRQVVKLEGDFAFDALSPKGRVLYLIQHVSATNIHRYLVRAYDLRLRSLRPAAIADRTQRGWVMQGTPVTRAASAGGRFVYTLYENPAGYPFVHALDTVAGTAHCIGLPWTGYDQVPLGALKLSPDGRRLTVGTTWNHAFYTVDTHTYRVTPAKPTPPAGHGDGFRWWLAAPLALLVALGIAVRRHHRRRALRTLVTAALK